MPPIAPLADTLQLVVVEGEDAGTSIALDQPRMVGTSEQADLVLTDRTVSRRHVAVEASAVGVRVRDQESRNGTWLGTGRVHDVEVPAGAEFRIGSTTLRVEAATGGPAPKTAPAPTIESFGRFVGRAKALQPLYQKLVRAAPSDATVLLEGESGTGKELLAEAIHDASKRADRPFIVVDCGSQLENLIESELFGHERGAFTGAERARIGAFEQAQGGTIFLDEIGELPLSLQTRLLRVLDRRQVQRLGGDKRIDVDVRIIAATNRNLEREVEASRFRLD
ncbi:MAG: sigma-54-dependent Fis family transcriptional regulator, partial [Deltaproteobacteria bacterium]